MREIKFRAWDTKHKHMFIVKEFGFSENNTWCTSKLNGYRHWNAPMMQFTGLKDKNGKEIYEGDICETVTYSGKPFGTIDIVKFSGGAFKLTDIEDALLPIRLDDSDIQSIEVIGNIFEHPHLIGGKHG